MQIIRLSLPLEDIFEPSVCGLGYFDGVHLGHQKLINKVISTAKETGLKSAIFTFDKSIDVVLGKKFNGEITPLAQRIKIFEDLGIDICYIFEFDLEISKMDPEKFIDNILKRLNIKKAVCGDDFHFGFKGQGNWLMLSKHINTIIVEFLNEDNVDKKVSSTSIIDLIINGNIEKACEYLGRPYFIEGKVVKGLGNGAKLGFPTANINYDGFVLPKRGVYLVNVIFEGITYKGLANVGTHPSIDEVLIPTLEVFIKDFNKKIYDLDIKIEFVKFIRDEMKFDSVENLKNQLNLDTFFNF